MGIVNKGAKCNVDGCTEDGVRSLNTKKIEDAGLDWIPQVKNLFYVNNITRNGKKKPKMTENLSVPDTIELDYGK